jgi:hypothetical protein
VGVVLSYERTGGLRSRPVPDLGYTLLDGTKSATALSYDVPASVAHFAQVRRLRPSALRPTTPARSRSASATSVPR